MPNCKLSDTVNVEVIKETTGENKLNHADIKFRFDQAWFYLLDFEAAEHANSIAAVDDYMKDFSRVAQALRQNELSLGQASFDQFFTLALCVKKLADTFDALDPEFDKEVEHRKVVDMRGTAEIMMRRLQNCKIEGDRNVFSQNGIPKMFFYPPLENDEQKGAYAADQAQVNDLQLIQIYVHLSAKFGPPSLIFTMLTAARQWLYAMAEQQRRAGMLLQMLQRLGDQAQQQGGGAGGAGGGAGSLPGPAP